MHEILPSVFTLHTRIRSIMPTCSLCGTRNETLRHCLFGCAWLNEIRRLCPRFRWCRAPARSFKRLVGWVFVHEEAEDQRLFVTVAWDIWKNRCATTFEGKMRAANICSEVENLLAVQHDEKERNDSQQPRVWFPPPQGHLAIHVDAACDQNGRRGGGAICRNW